MILGAQVHRMRNSIGLCCISAVSFGASHYNIRHGSVVERRSPELHTDLVRVRDSARLEPKIFLSG